MPDAIAPLHPAHPGPRPTLLVIEDSRFTCEALRLLALRAGLRLRRAATLAQAAQHLGTYRPDAVLVDLGLPDGRGDDLIRALHGTPERPRLILGMSGDPNGRALALAAGADGFLDKAPGAFGDLLAMLPIHAAPIRHALAADPLALRDDLAYAADLLSCTGDRPDDYLVGFLTGIAQASGDTALADAARMRNAPQLSAVVTARLAASAPF